MGVGSYCYVASGAVAPTGGGEGRDISRRHVHSLYYVTLCYELSCKAAVDLSAAPVSQAYIERLFSVSGMLSHGKMKQNGENSRNESNVLHEIE